MAATALWRWTIRIACPREKPVEIRVVASDSDGGRR
jgi:hypothetical protein